MSAPTRTHRRSRAAGPAWVAVCLLLVAACGGGTGTTAREGLLDTPDPDLSSVQPFGQAQATTRLNALAAALGAPGTEPAALAQAYGDVGQILLAADLLDAAEPYLRNAATLAPGDERWPYYLGQLYRMRGDLDDAAAQLEAARDRGADPASTNMWLGVVYAALDRPADAADAYERVLAAAPDTVPALIALGEVEVSQGDTQSAIEHLQDALTADPTATAAHGVLAEAYRQLGDEPLAATHAQLEGDGSGRLPDPLMDPLPALLETAQAFENRAFLAANEGDWSEAVAQFRQAAALQPNDGTMQMNLGTAMINAGDGVGARRAFLAAEGIDPQSPQPQMALGTLYLTAGHYREAIERFQLAAVLDPELPEARVRLADTLRQDGRPAAALPIYGGLIDEDVNNLDATFGLAIALVQLERWSDALDVLSDGMARFPEDPRFFHAAARLLVAAPDPSVRDGLLALDIVKSLLVTEVNNLEVGETMAMVMAENGIWVDALNWQRGTLEGARELGYDQATIDRLEENLARFERNEPVREPWPPDHPIFQPGGPVQPDLLPD